MCRHHKLLLQNILTIVVWYESSANRDRNATIWHTLCSFTSLDETGVAESIEAAEIFCLKERIIRKKGSSCRLVIET
jgi:hypothetical protein